MQPGDWIWDSILLKILSTHLPQTSGTNLLGGVR